MTKLLLANEVAMILGIAVDTLDRWYWFKKENPDNDYAKMLPDIIYQNNAKNRRTRYWREEDIDKLIEFKQIIPHGRNGILGSVTQKYVKKKGEQ